MHGEPEISQGVENEREVGFDVGTLSEYKSAIVCVQRLAVVALKRALLRCQPASQDTVLIIAKARFRGSPPSVEHLEFTDQTKHHEAMAFRRVTQRGQAGTIPPCV